MDRVEDDDGGGGDDDDGVEDDASPWLETSWGWGGTGSLRFRIGADVDGHVAPSEKIKQFQAAVFPSNCWGCGLSVVDPFLSFKQFAGDHWSQGQSQTPYGAWEGTWTDRKTDNDDDEDDDILMILVMTSIVLMIILMMMYPDLHHYYTISHQIKSMILIITSNKWLKKSAMFPLFYNLWFQLPLANVWLQDTLPYFFYYFIRFIYVMTPDRHDICSYSSQVPGVSDVCLVN